MLHSIDHWAPRLAAPRALAVAVLASLALTAMPAQAVTYDAVGDFQVAGNPGDVWAYGYSHEVSPTYSMILFDSPDSNPSWLSWTKAGYITLGTPAAAKNVSGAPINGAQPGQLILHPGPLAFGDNAILRFTAPATANYDVVGQFFAGDGGSMSGSVVLDGNLASPLQSFASTTDDSKFKFTSLFMAKSETLDLVVGNNGSFYYGTTPLTMTITSAVPEPGSVLLVLAGLAAIRTTVRRRQA